MVLGLKVHCSRAHLRSGGLADFGSAFAKGSEFVGSYVIHSIFVNQFTYSIHDAKGIVHFWRAAKNFNKYLIG
jgi:hypothetical protein